MNTGKYIFSQFVEFLPKRVFDGIVKKYNGDKYVKTFTCWSQLLVMMFGQLSSCDSSEKSFASLMPSRIRVTISDLATET